MLSISHTAVGDTETMRPGEGKGVAGFLGQVKSQGSPVAVQ